MGGRPDHAQTITGAIAEREGPGNPGNPGTEVATRDPVRKFVDRISGELAKQLPAHIPIDYFARTCVTGLRRSDQLAQIARTPRGQASIYVALLEAARFGLMPFTEEGAVVAFGQEATWIPQWQGLVKMIYNTGRVSAVALRFIYQRDTWELSYGTTDVFVHRPWLVHEDGTPVTPEERGEPILAYFYLRFTDGTMSEVTTVTRQQALEVRDKYSKSYRRAENNGKRNSTWHTNELAMWLKTAARQGSRTAPKSPMLAELLLAAARDDTEQPEGSAPPRPEDLGADPDVLDGESLYDSDEDGDLGPAGDQHPPAPAPPRETPRPRPQAWRRINGMFSDLDLAGDLHKPRRLAICRVLGSETGDPLDITTSAQLSDAQLEQIIARLRDIHREYASGPEGAERVRAGLEGMALRGGWAPAEESR